MRHTEVVQFDRKIHTVYEGSLFKYAYRFSDCPECKQFKMKRVVYPDGSGYEVCYNCDHLRRWEEGEDMNRIHPERTEYDLSIDPCCRDMEDAVMMNDIREGIIEYEGQFYIVWGDGDMIPLKYCPSCGKPIKKRDMENKCIHCPECAVLFDNDGGYHGVVPDSHSQTCKTCLKDNNKCPNCGNDLLKVSDLHCHCCTQCNYKRDDE